VKTCLPSSLAEQAGVTPLFFLAIKAKNAGIA
jgi:hypothetical protein